MLIGIVMMPASAIYRFIRYISGQATAVSLKFQDTNDALLQFL